MVSSEWGHMHTYTHKNISLFCSVFECMQCVIFYIIYALTQGRPPCALLLRPSLSETDRRYEDCKALIVFAQSCSLSLWAHMCFTQSQHPHSLFFFSSFESYSTVWYNYTVSLDTASSTRPLLLCTHAWHMLLFCPCVHSWRIKHQTGCSCSTTSKCVSSYVWRLRKDGDWPCVYVMDVRQCRGGDRADKIKRAQCFVMRGPMWVSEEDGSHYEQAAVSGK